MGLPGIAVQLIDEGNSESAVRFLSEWVCDGEAEARRYLAEHLEPDGTSLIATSGPDAVGYVAIIWESNYAGFRSRGITTLGITVGLFDEYGPAQRMYGRRGYIPDGSGACQGQRPLSEGTQVRLDHDVILWLTKDLTS
ncbi:MAG: hypothetical protein QOG28_3802 [Trebonia sp.]|nr:hypothetical protein [Trebonia sp.]